MMPTIEVRCSDCKQRAGSQHRPSCHRQGLVTGDSHYSGNEHFFQTYQGATPLSQTHCAACGLHIDHPIHAPSNRETVQEPRP